MARPANAVDFWRGFALVTIFINHVPGLFYERLTHRNISISDSAELFVFLAGWSLGLMVASFGKAYNPARLFVRLGGRAIKIYAAQILISSLALALLAVTAIVSDNPLILEWHNAAAVFQEPQLTHIGLVLLTHQLGYFDILPLYVVLMLLGPGLGLANRYFPQLILPLSLGLYFASLITPFTAPTWPVPGQWFFNPFTWQAVFVLGFVLSRDEGLGAVVRRHITTIWWIALPVVVVAGVMVLFNWFPDPTRLPEPKLLFLNGKSFLTPMRLIQFLALVAVFSASFPYIFKVIPWMSNQLSLLGRNSLNVFCVASLLSLLGQIIRFVYSGSLFVDTIVLVVGVGLLWLTGWISEWKEQSLVLRLRTAAAIALALTFTSAGSLAQTGGVQPNVQPGVQPNVQPGGQPSDAAGPPMSGQPATVPDLPGVPKECGSVSGATMPLPNSALAIQERKQLRILGIGASIKPVVGSSRDGKPPLLEQILEHTIKGLDVVIVNRGFSGELAAATSERLKVEVALSHPDVVLWQVGTNDAFAQVPVEEFEETVRTTVRWLKEHNIDVIMVGLHYMKHLVKNENYQAIRMSLQRIAASENVLRIGRYEAMEVLERTTRIPGQPEPTAFGYGEPGYNCMAQYVAHAMAVGLYAKPPLKNPAPSKPSVK